TLHFRTGRNHVRPTGFTPIRAPPSRLYQRLRRVGWQMSKARMCPNHRVPSLDENEMSPVINLEGKKFGRAHPLELVKVKPLYTTALGAACVGDSRALLKLLPSESINAIITSPPYALRFKKSYGNPDQETYVDWFLGF